MDTPFRGKTLGPVDISTPAKVWKAPSDTDFIHKAIISLLLTTKIIYINQVFILLCINFLVIYMTAERQNEEEQMKKRTGKLAIRVAVSFAAVAALVALTLAGCPTGLPGAGVSGFAKGTITAKGSIFVNGVEYDTSGSQITVDDQSGADSDLQVGMVVSVKGSIDPLTGIGIADQIEYAKSIEGVVGTVDKANAPNGSFDVFGVTVTVDATTVYEGVSGLAGLYGDEQVEVSGTATATGILASRVEVKLAAEDFNLKGVVSSLSGSGFDLTVEGGAVFTVVIDSGTLAAGVIDGAYVEVEFALAPVGSTFHTTADKVKPEHGLSPDDGDRAELSGVVTAYSAGPPVTFTVEGTSVDASGATISGTLTDGIEVEVRGTMDGTVLMATTVRVHQDADSKIEATVASIDVGAGTIVLAGVTVAVDTSTIFKDEDWTGHVPVEHFSVADLAADNRVQVEAWLDGSTVRAAKIERTDPADTQAALQGLATAAATPNVTVLGVAINTTGFTFNEFVDQAAFFAALVPGSDKVKLSGTTSGSVVTWDTIAIDD
jgi:hypothetical protein